MRAVSTRFIRTMTSISTLLCRVCALVTVLVSLSAARAEGVTRTWTVAGTDRTAIVHLPATDPAKTLGTERQPVASPLILAFHGHGGRAQFVERALHFQKEWPQAVVVYPQGLPTKTSLDPKGTGTGWQIRAGTNEDRDLAFVDAIVASLRAEGWIDDTRIYAAGHSNGGGFTYALWGARHDLFAAVALIATGSLELSKLKPLPCMHIAGRGDKIVKISFQEKVMKEERVVNGSVGEGVEWATNCTQWSSEGASAFVAMITDGGHGIPTEAPPLMVRFFKEQVKVDVKTDVKVDVKVDVKTEPATPQPDGLPKSHSIIIITDK